MKLFKFRRVCDEFNEQLVFVVAADVNAARRMANIANEEDGLPVVNRDYEVTDVPGMLTLWRDFG